MSILRNLGNRVPPTINRKRQKRRVRPLNRKKMNGGLIRRNLPRSRNHLRKRKRSLINKKRPKKKRKRRGKMKRKKIRKNEKSQYWIHNSNFSKSI